MSKILSKFFDRVIEVNYVEIGRNLLLPVPGFTNLFMADLTGVNLSDSQVIIGFTAKNFREDLEFEMFDYGDTSLFGELSLTNTEFNLDFVKNQIQRVFVGRLIYDSTSSFDNIADDGEILTVYLYAQNRDYDEPEEVEVYSQFRIIIIKNSEDLIDSIVIGG